MEYEGDTHIYQRRLRTTQDKKYREEAEGKREENGEDDGRDELKYSVHGRWMQGAIVNSGSIEPLRWSDRVNSSSRPRIALSTAPQSVICKTACTRCAISSTA